MSVLRLALRLQLRSLLEDNGLNPVWDDATMNIAIAQALHAYSSRFPVESSTTLAVTAGVVSYALPAGVEGERIVRLIDTKGGIVPRMVPLRSGPPLSDLGNSLENREQAFRAWAGTLTLDRAPAAQDAGSWTLHYLGAIPEPASDVVSIPVALGDEPIVVRLAGAILLDTRAAADGKRGRNHLVDRQANLWREEAHQLMYNRRRRVRSGYVAS